MIECIKFVSYSKGTLLGYADFYIPKMGLEIYGCQLHQKNGRRWVNFPAKEYTKPDGEKGYSFIVRFRDKDHQSKFGEEALKAIDAYCQKEGKLTNDDNDGLPF